VRVAAIAATFAACSFTADRIPPGYDGRTKPKCSSGALPLADAIAGTVSSYFFVDQIRDDHSRKEIDVALMVLSIVELSSAMIGAVHANDCSDAWKLYEKHQAIKEGDEEEIEGRRRRRRRFQDLPLEETQSDAGIDAPVDAGLPIDAREE
jgi:hypothetical protein